MVSVVVLLVLSAVLGRTTALDEPIAVRKFSLVTKNGENVLHKDFDRRRLTDGLDHLCLAFRAANHVPDAIGLKKMHKQMSKYRV
mgnify:CR=1 FL=1